MRAESPTLAASRSVTTDANGAYQIPGLQAGVYKLTVTHSGFGTRVFEGLELTLNRTFNFDVKLEVGKVQERVEDRVRRLHRRRRHVGVREHDVLARPHRVEAEFVGQPGQAHRVGGSEGGRRVQTKDSELHGAGQ